MLIFPGLSLGDELGLAESLGNLEGDTSERRRAINYNGRYSNDIGVLPASEQPVIFKFVFFLLCFGIIYLHRKRKLDLNHINLFIDQDRFLIGYKQIISIHTLLTGVSSHQSLYLYRK